MTCVECRRKKVRCNKNGTSCLRCDKLKIECVPAIDGRRDRICVQETERLRSRVKELENALNRIQSNPFIPFPIVTETDPALHPKPAVYTSVHNLLSRENGKNGLFRSFDETIVPVIPTLHRDMELVHDLQSFFQWLYQDISSFFLPREPFLVELYHGPASGEKPVFCTTALAFAAGALGSMTRGNLERAEKLHSAALSEMGAETSSSVSIAGMQTWLLLAIWDIYAGAIDSAWVKVGVASRICEGLSLCDEGEGEGEGEAPIEGVARIAWVFRGRIFWGALLLERFVAVLWGGGERRFTHEIVRQPTPTERVPDLEWVAREGVFNFARGMVIEVAEPLRAIVALLETVSGGTGGGDSFSFSDSRFAAWRNSLPPHLAWTAPSLHEKGRVPPQLVHVHFYYAYRLATAVAAEAVPTDAVLADAVEAADFVVAPFLAQHGAQRASVLLVCTCVAALEVILRSGTVAAAAAAERGGGFRSSTSRESRSRAWRLVHALEQCGSAGMRLGNVAAQRMREKVHGLFGSEEKEKETAEEKEKETVVEETVVYAEPPWSEWPDWAEWAWAWEWD